MYDLDMRLRITMHDDTDSGVPTEIMEAIMAISRISCFKVKEAYYEHEGGSYRLVKDYVLALEYIGEMG